MKPEALRDSAAGADDNPDLFDYAQMMRQGGFVLRSVGRHRALFLTVLVAMVAVTGLLATVWPRAYHVQTKILAQRNQVMAALGNPHRSIPSEADAPTRAASETVLRRDNLVSLVKQTNLVDNWDAARIPLLRFKDKGLSLVGGSPSEEDKLESLILLLEKRLAVTTGEGTVTISIDWPSAQMAFQLVEAAQQNFLEARHVTEVATIEEAISILEAHADNVHGSIERALDELEKLQSGSLSAPAVSPGAPPKPRPMNLGLGESGPEQELTQIKFLLRAKRRAISDLEDFRQKRLGELHAQLAEQKAVYSDQHPIIVDTHQRITALNGDSPQIVALKQDEQELLGEYRRRGGKDPDSFTEPSTRSALARTEVQPTAAPVRSREDSPQLAYAREQLRIASDTYQDIILRIDAARIELDTARAAFKYRYSVVNPAKLPKKPDKPNVPMLIFSGLMGGLLVAVLAALLADIRKGRFVESWQVAHNLGIALVAEVREP